MIRRLAVSTRNGLVQSVPQNILGCGNLLCAVLPEPEPPGDASFYFTCSVTEFIDANVPYEGGEIPVPWFDREAAHFTLSGPGWSAAFPTEGGAAVVTGTPPPYIDNSTPFAPVTLTQGANSVSGTGYWTCG